MKDKVLGSRVATISIIVVVVLLAGLVWDSASNWGKAYSNVTVAGMNVGGMNAEQIRDAMVKSFGNTVKGASVKVYASEEAKTREESKFSQEEQTAQSEQISAEEATSKKTSWVADGTTLGATFPYEKIAKEAIEAGRNGGPFARIAVAVAGQDIPISVEFDANSLEEFAATVDKTVGDARIDTTVEINNGVASPVQGHDGYMLDRSWLSSKLSDAMLSGDSNAYLIAQTADAPSRTTMEQAQAMSDSINRALKKGVTFTYKSRNWTADATEVGKWTRVFVEQSGDGYGLGASIDSAAATSAIVQNISGAKSSADNESITVDFEKSSDGVLVHTSGSGEIPEVVPAVSQLDETLFGSSGIAWSAGDPSGPVAIEINESNAPETLTFDQAVELGLITVIGKYSTEFSNEEGTENRNHNIKLVSDLISDSICEANGGTWSFNEHSGDTNLDPPFASAGSIVNGEYVDSIGGGICQVATTVFNAVFEGGLDVVQRRNHSLYIASYPTGRDVGVSYPELDFVWKNKLQSDVLLKLEYTDTSVTAKLYSVYTGYQVESTTGEWQEGDTYKTNFETDESLAKGDYYLKTVGSDGSKVSVTRTVKDKSGNVIAEDVFDSVYEPKNEVYLIGPGTDTSNLVHTAAPKSESTDSSEDSEYDSSSTEESTSEYAADESTYDETYDTGTSDDSQY